MSTAVTGIVHGKTITLDESVPRLEGQRVRISMEPLCGTDIALAPEEQVHLLRQWAARGPQGPLEGPDQWPDESR